MRRHLFALALSSVLAIPAISHARSKGGFTDISIRYLDQISRTAEKSLTRSYKDDFGYLELGGGADFSQGEVYGFFSWESFYSNRHDKLGNEQRCTFKNTNRIYLGDTGSNLYLHAYSTYDSVNCVNSHDDIFLYGIGYNLTGNGWQSKPLFAERHTDQIYYTGDNGYVAGQVAGYSPTLGSEKFTLTNWNEYEFDRGATYAIGNGGKEGLDSAVALWWNATSHITTGIQYRYTDNKLGEDFYQDAIIYPTKFNF